MSQTSSDDDEVDHIDLTCDDDNYLARSSSNTPVVSDTESIILGFDNHGDPVPETIHNNDLMDVDVEEITSHIRRPSRMRDESSLFVHDSMTPPVGLIDLTGDDGERAVSGNSEQPQEDHRLRSESSLFVPDNLPSPPPPGGDSSSDDSDEPQSDPDEPDEEESHPEDEDEEMNDAHEEEEPDEAIQDTDDPNEDEEQEQTNPGGDPGDDDDPGDDSDNDEESSDSDSDSDSESENEDHVPYDERNPNAELHEALSIEHVTEPNWARQCLRTCKPHWDEVANLFWRYHRRFLRKRIEFRTLKARHRQRIRELREENERLKARRKRRPHEKSWREILRLAIEEGQWPPEIRGWEDIYKLSCKEENMSWAFSAQKGPKLHPCLELRPPTDEENKEDDDEEELPGPEPGWGPPPRRPSPPDQPPPPGGSRRSAFERLDIELQIRIFSHLFVFDGGLVHAISRLDPYHKATEVPRDCNGRISLLHRFHIGHESVSLTFGAVKPQELLAPLLVSKHFNFLGASIFYGANTLQHLQHVEILWIGSQRLVYKPDRKGRYTSRRTHHLAWFTEVHRLKSISIYTPESSKWYMRRRHEPRHIVEYMAEKTAGQPNCRRFRALRTLQGLDYLHNLRGLNGITFWDYDKWLEMQSKLPVRDWTFVRDLNNTVRRAKTEEDQELCRLRMLAPFVIGYRPRNSIINKIEAFVNQYSPGCGGQVIDLTMDDE